MYEICFRMFYPSFPCTLNLVILHCGALQRSSRWSVACFQRRISQRKIFCVSLLCCSFLILTISHEHWLKAHFSLFIDSLTVSDIRQTGYKICWIMFLERDEIKEIWPFYCRRSKWEMTGLWKNSWVKHSAKWRSVRLWCQGQRLDDNTGSDHSHWANWVIMAELILGNHLFSFYSTYCCQLLLE